MIAKIQLPWIALLAPLLLSACSQNNSSIDAVNEAQPSISTKSPDQGHAELALNAYFGDLHIHTAYSLDAYTVGNRTTPDDAYLYAKGHTIAHAAGYPVTIDQPLDFAAVTDHAEYFGILPEMGSTGGALSHLQLAKDMISGDPVKAGKSLQSILIAITTNTLIPEMFDKDIIEQAWKETVIIADRHYQPGEFTSLVGYEWSSATNGNSLHRNVIFRGNQVPDRPFGSYDSDKPEDLWTHLEETRANNMQVLAIPHNANMSNGLMYPVKDSWGKALDETYAKRRMINEPINEIVQIKGQSETHPILSTEDEFAGQEIYSALVRLDNKEPTISGSYAREAYRTGLKLGNDKGFNPFKFGVIGSSDSHGSTSPVEEYNYTGKLPMIDGTPEKRLGLSTTGPEYRSIIQGAAGLAAVWAHENTREAIYDALARKETFATSGPRIKLRFFAGWDYPLSLTEDHEFIAKAYANGVPMGSDIVPSTNSIKSPRFAIAAVKGPKSGNLDRVQVIKVWLDQTGQSREKIFDAIHAGERNINPDTGKLEPIGSTVNLENASYKNSIGSPTLSTVWIDPEFKADQSAAYYLRVLEIPTPRWSTYDAAKLNVKPSQPATIQEMAWSSPIWYQPR